MWKAIPNYEGLYEVSSFGRVRSLDKEINHSTSGGTFIRRGKIMKPGLDGRGYYKLNLTLSKKKIHVVHKLVAMAFLGHVPCGHDLEIHHIDENKINNRLDNLEVLTKQEHKAKHSKNREGLSSKYMGVSWKASHGKWCAQATINKKKVHIGLFTSEEEAHEACKRKLTLTY